MTILPLILSLALPAAGGEGDEIRNLRKDINLLNLLNGLHMDAKQLHELQKVHARLARVRAKFRGNPASEIRSRKLRIDALEKIKRILEEGGTPQPYLYRQARTSLEIKGPGYVRKRNGEVSQAMNEATKAVLGILTPGQKQILITYKACLIPPRNLTNPVRVGQANDSSFAKRLLQRVRRIPRARYARGPQPVVQWLVNTLDAKGGGLTPRQRKEAQKTLLEIVREVRGMSDLDFNLRADELAEKVAVWDRHHEARKIIQETVPDGLVRRNVSVFLLDPRIPVLLKEKARLALSPIEGGLESVEKADNCDDGGCALPETPAKGKVEIRNQRIRQ